MRSPILLDTNIVIGVLNNTLAAERYAFGHPVISTVTVMELYALAGTSEEEERKIDNALAVMEVVPVTFAIARRAGLLARTRRRSVRSDLLIAATAIELGLILITVNEKDYRGIPGLYVKQRY